MAIKTQPQPPFTCDLESERDSSWPEGVHVFCKDTQKLYVLINGIFINTTGGGTTPVISLFDLDANGDLEPGEGSTELLELDANGDLQPKG
jgi:hypothetical protein